MTNYAVNHIMDELLYLAWTTQFVKEDNEVDEARRIYKADGNLKRQLIGIQLMMVLFGYY